MTNKKLLIAGIFTDILTIGAVLFQALKRGDSGPSEGCLCGFLKKKRYCKDPDWYK